MTEESEQDPIYTAAHARAAAMSIKGVVDAYVLSETNGAVTLTAVIVPGMNRGYISTRLVDTFEGRTKAGIVWSFEVLEGES